MIVPFDQPPLDPSSPQAQQWARDELAHGRYDTSVPWWRQLIEWLLSHTSGGPSAGLPSWMVPLVVVVVLAAVGLVVALVLRREGRATTDQRRPERRPGRGGVVRRRLPTAGQGGRRAG